jgi:hypothetical protein
MIFSARDFNEYLGACGGLERMRKLRKDEFLL